MIYGSHHEHISVCYLSKSEGSSLPQSIFFLFYYEKKLTHTKESSKMNLGIPIISLHWLLTHVSLVSFILCHFFHAILKKVPTITSFHSQILTLIYI